MRSDVSLDGERMGVAGDPDIQNTIARLRARGRGAEPLSYVVGIEGSMSFAGQAAYGQVQVFLIDKFNVSGNLHLSYGIARNHTFYSFHVFRSG